MKINPTGNANFITGNYRPGKVSAYTQTRAASRSDEALLSDEALSFSKVFAQTKEAVKAEESGRAERISEIKAQVQSGTYRVDSDKIADSILGFLV